ncbi:WecB/TagA/CpsF family glycosyltransferase [Xanthomonas campestris pv. raphani]|uniref:WecB/TagA/CpsF family glycosyltransferase n=1 Tax=Xanthomonas campestris TaxID=339 RepID=UPI001E5CA414|nr:WecB/TagA/CpsF family glycosyltransferase [Xanthomonas campestris]MCC5085348.1 WecB/TagA/CpsF family glycosyltransferase [Xanthomonas campestris]MEA9884880.1 WecB/TagA/CpsF family glycosyltransferase [Xanthomonas campestris pv. raphani]MEB2182824.1 WecB/TagA/CpsF family glycosyltransferase [Xanthomonas campestris pv. campestris]
MHGQPAGVETATVSPATPAQGVVIPLGGFPVLSTTQEAFALDLFHALAAHQPRRVFFANTNFIVQCQALRARMQAPAVRIVNDGIGMDLAARLIHGRRFAGNLNGTDLIPYLCREAAQPLKFFLLGGRPGVGKTAAATLTGTLGQQVVGMCDGYGEFAAAGEGLAERINRSGADVLLVAFGNPLQERWILDHGEALQVPLVFGVGALLDFLSGTAKRAPNWVRRLHMEWMYRLLNEPRRLLKRYSWDLLVFFRTCLRAGKQLA